MLSGYVLWSIYVLLFHLFSVKYNILLYSLERVQNPPIQKLIRHHSSYLIMFFLTCSWCSFFIMASRADLFIYFTLTV